MAAIILPRKHYSQPQGSVAGDFSGRFFDPSRVSAVLLPAHSARVDAFSGAHYASTADPQLVINSEGVGYPEWEINNSLALGPADGVGGVLDTTSCTMIVVIVRTSGAMRNASYFGFDDSSTKRVLVHFPFTDGNIYWDFGTTTTGRGSVSSSAFLSAGTISAWAFVAGSRGREIWRNGRRLVGDATKTHVRSGSTSSFVCGMHKLGTSPSTNTFQTSLFFLSKEEMSESSLERLTASPYEIFRAEPTRIFSFPPVLTIPTLSSPGVIDIGTTSARPQVTLTY